ncbi:DUF3144 domain-containing protein [Pseudomonas sp. MSSRFD41]|uniref:DUF3144 domain-containing protein n=1 Tax=Pseudomonas sp. MSSRFD41 TaxID=1310370 RepID=UPI00163B364D|nr:DUF3144 domain-containing protein [Pseudomonas sp. MSSRFD41]MBC2658849.1 DUF3144 domain-containing protein [Pseudomonas sp. MSSRFD41]
MANEPDHQFFDRADAIIDLANSQVATSGRGKVSASLMYANARFCAFIRATGCRDAEEMAASKQQTLDYFVDQFRHMLDEHLTDYAEHFAQYTNRSPE